MECQICSTRSRPQEAEQGQLCDRCATTLRQTIGDLELCLLAVTAVKGKAGPQGEPVSGNKPGSRSPANDTAIVHTDLRSAWSEEDGYGAFAVLHSWATDARAAHGIEEPTKVTVSSEARDLLAAFESVVQADWVVEAAEELSEAHRAIQRLIGVAPEKPVGPCQQPDCSGRVYSTGDRASCRDCDYEYGGLRLAEIRHGETLDPMDRVSTKLAVQALADYGKPITAKGLRNWANRGHVSYDDGWDMIELLEYVNRKNVN